MELKNTTDFPNHFLRRMISFCCRELDLKIKRVRCASFGNKTTGGAYRGLAHTFGFRVSIGTKKFFAVDGKEHPEHRVRTLVDVTAHELAHLDNYVAGNRSRQGGGWGGSERWTQHKADLVMQVFEKRPDELIAAWSKEPAVRCTAPKKPLVEQRAEHARKMLTTWNRKLKLAKTKQKHWAAKVRYYEKAYNTGDKT